MSIQYFEHKHTNRPINHHKKINNFNETKTKIKTLSVIKQRQYSKEFRLFIPSWGPQVSDLLSKLSWFLFCSMFLCVYSRTTVSCIYHVPVETIKRAKKNYSNSNQNIASVKFKLKNKQKKATKEEFVSAFPFRNVRSFSNAFVHLQNNNFLYFF